MLNKNLPYALCKLVYIQADRNRNQGAAMENKMLKNNKKKYKHKNM